MELLFGLIIVGFLLYRYIVSSPKYKGKAGERKVVAKIQTLPTSLKDARVFHDITLRTPDGTTQIDHLIISCNGIFVIETKNMSGWIFGNEHQSQWTQIVYKKRSKFQNPVHQNHKHVKAVQNLLSADSNIIFNVVVFAGSAKFKTKMPANVVTKNKLRGYIRSHRAALIDSNDIEKYASIIERTAKESAVSPKEHIKNIRKNQKNPVCPRCGAAMVLRTAKTGRSKGSKFWGCSKYPECKATKRHD